MQAWSSNDGPSRMKSMAGGPRSATLGGLSLSVSLSCDGSRLMSYLCDLKEILTQTIVRGVRLSGSS